MKRSYLPYFFLVLLLFQGVRVIGQEKSVVQIKVFDQQLKPLPNIELSINGKEFFSVGGNGSVFIELHHDDLPPRSINIRNTALEAASWNYSKGILEIIVRKKTYQIIPFLVKDQDGKPIGNAEITFNGKTNVTTRSSAGGEFEIPVSLQEGAVTEDKFAVANYNVLRISRTENGNAVIVAPIQAIVKDAPAVAEEPVQAEPAYFQDFDLSKLDSITSLTVFYAIFKNYHVSNLDSEIKEKLDAKLKMLVDELDDSVSRNILPAFIGNISDSSFVSDDVRNLLAQARLENRLLEENKEAFDDKIEVLRGKLEAGIENLDPATREKLLADLNRLQAILEENESKFYQNQSHYRAILSSLNEKFFDLEHLENRLSESEAQRMQERQNFKKQLITILSIVAVIVAVLIFLIYIRNKLKAQKTELVRVNSEIKRINENLENLVSQRTKLLQEANRELDLFLYKASHDLRSPVTSIKGLANLATTTGNKAEHLELFQKVANTAHSMDRLLQKLRLISEINQPGAFSSIEVLGMINTIKGNLSSFIAEKKIDVAVDCPANLRIYCNGPLTEAILFYLFENAVFYAAIRHTRHARVEISARVIDGNVQFSFYDNGVGIEEHLVKNIFDMFYIGHERSTGHGLGLYIVGKSVNALKGRIEVQSEVNSFTRVVVTIPTQVSIPKQPDALLDPHARPDLLVEPAG